MAERLTQISEAQACDQLARFDMRPPVGYYTVQQAVQGAICWQLQGERGQIVFSLRELPGVTWIDAAAGDTEVAMLPELLACIEDMARKDYMTEMVAFQTVRPGLVKAAAKLGYEVKGWILGKRVDREPAA